MKITKKFISENLTDDFQNYDDTIRMNGNEPTYETALLYWLSKMLPNVKWILTDQGTKKRWSKKKATQILYDTAIRVQKEEGEKAKDFFNSGTPVHLEIN